MSDFLGTFKTDVIFKDEIEQTLQPPSMYKVLLNNDDYTPMDFVVEVLQKYFSFDEERATQIMLDVHIQGREFVEFLLQRLLKLKRQVNTFAREHEYPLLCTIEKV
ncbi:ATP-dependent Clp protease adaptor ClpS [Providencia rettgeri]|nr:ATP-dependent Clp protease adaptor ClpS [Providencia rettgeri]